MSQEPGQPAQDEQVPRAGRVAETGTPEAGTGEPDTPGTAEAGAAETGTPRAGIPEVGPDDTGSARPAPAGAGPEESAVDLDGPLLADAEDLRASWHRIQAGFVDDPREAVAEAASLVEHTAQALSGALRQRQRLLRAGWDRGRAPDGPGASASGSAEGGDASGGGQPAADGSPDTERLRHVMRRYRDLFDDICRPPG